MSDIESIRRGALLDHAAELRRRNEVFDSDSEFGGPLDDGPEHWLMEHRHEIADALEKTVRLDEAERLLREAKPRVFAIGLGPDPVAGPMARELEREIREFLDT